ncbi:MAG: hypothetical protein AB1538_04035 [Bacillota bacterium]
MIELKTAGVGQIPWRPWGIPLGFMATRVTGQPPRVIDRGWQIPAAMMSGLWGRR